jgi:hypothetical protein
MVLFVLLSGCLQSPPVSPVTPQQTGTVVIVGDIPEPAVSVASRRIVNLTAEKTTDSVVVRVDGGKDVGGLSSLSVRISNYDGTSVQRTLPSPSAGKTYTIQYYRMANADTINIIGTFSDGYQQTLLITSL